MSESVRVRQHHWDPLTIRSVGIFRRVWQTPGNSNESVIGGVLAICILGLRGLQQFPLNVVVSGWDEEVAMRSILLDALVGTGTTTVATRIDYAQVRGSNLLAIQLHGPPSVEDPGPDDLQNRILCELEWSAGGFHVANPVCHPVVDSLAMSRILVVPGARELGVAVEVWLVVCLAVFALLWADLAIWDRSCLDK